MDVTLGNDFRIWNRLNVENALKSSIPCNEKADLLYSTSTAYDSLLLKFAGVVQDLKNGNFDGNGLELFKIGLEALKHAGIDRYKSKTRFAYGELYSSLEQSYKKNNKQWMALWSAAMNIWKNRDLDVVDLVLPNCSSVGPVFTGDPVRDLVSWRNSDSSESHLLKYLASGDFTHLMRASGEFSGNEQELFKIRLLAIRGNQDVLHSKFPSFLKLHRRMSEGEEGKLCQSVHRLEQLLQKDEPDDIDFLKVGELVGDVICSDSTVHMRLMTLSGVYFLLDKRRKKKLASVVKQAYHSLNLQASGYKVRDGYLIEKRPSAKRKPGQSRVSSYLHLTSAVSSVLGKSAFNKYLAGENYRLRSDSLDKSLFVLADVLSEMQGPLMKLGQLLSYMVSDIEPGWRDEFLELTHSAKYDTSLNPRAELLKLGASLDLDLEEIPIGCGSVSQVYKGRLGSGEDIAVKCLTPGIQRAMRADIAVLRSLSFLVNLVSKGSDWSHIQNEIENCLMGELDLGNEAQVMEQLREKFLEEPYIRIPRVHRQLSSPSILTSEYVSGLHFDEFLNFSSQERKDLAGQAVVKFVVTSVRDGVFSSDPHPGNYVFTDDAVHFLDFGSSASWNKKTIEGWNDLILAFLNYDFAEFERVFDRLGAISPKTSRVELRNLFEILTRPQKGFWNYPGVQALDGELIEKQMQLLAKLWMSPRLQVRLPPEYIQGLRVYYCHLFVAARLGARHDWPSLVNSIMLK